MCALYSAKLTKKTDNTSFESKKEQLKIGFFPTLSMLYNNYTNNILHPD